MRKIHLLLLILIGAIIYACEKDDSSPNLEKGYCDLKTITAWKISSVPERFSESKLNNDLTSGFNRAKIAWYYIDPLFLRNNSLTPSHILNDVEQQSSHYVREIYEDEIFPSKEAEESEVSAIRVLNLAYYPEERGPYNYDTYKTEYSEGINSTGLLNNPRSRWGGIQRELLATTVAYDTLEFWLMDPFVYNENITGDLFFNYGEISEDVLKDSKMSRENLLSTDEADISELYTCWGRIPNAGSNLWSFLDIEQQDLGFDGLNDVDERTFFNEYLDEISQICYSDIYEEVKEDPSNDNFHYYLGADYDVIQLSILERYKRYNNISGNSSGGSWQITTKQPDTEDFNTDEVLEKENNYVEYNVSIRKSDFIVGQNYIVEERFGYNVDLPNGEQNVEIAWYHFKIPMNNYQNTIGLGSIDGTASAMRIYLTGFEEEVILRFAELNLIGMYDPNIYY